MTLFWITSIVADLFIGYGASQVSVSSLTFALRTVQDMRVMMDVSITASSANNGSISESVSTSVAVYNLRDRSGSGSSVSYKR